MASNDGWSRACARFYIELINGPFLFKDKGSPAEYGVGMKLAIRARLAGDA